MRQLALGLILGIAIGASITAFAAGLYGDGVLAGWSVIKDGQQVCTDPTVSTDVKEIECN
jgi:hypothetical protein